MSSSSDARGSSSSGMLERRDVWLDEAFRVVTEGTLPAPNALQQALFPRLMTQDTGLFIPTGPCAGRLEAIAIPSLVGMRLDAKAHRLFIVGPDGGPLDDYFYRLCPYVRSLVIADGTERTIWFEEPDRAPIARKYLPDGSYDSGAAHHPFSDDVDLVVMPLSHFRAVFFNAGGIYGVPEVTGFDTRTAEEMAPRGLFYFDEAYGATREQQLEFVRLVEFLFAQDLDVVVGGSSLPQAAADEMAFLDPLQLPEAQRQPVRTLRYEPADGPGDTLAAMERIVREVYFQNSRVILTLTDPADSRLGAAYERLVGAYPSNVYAYNSRASRSERGRVYAHLRELEKEGEGYLLVVDGPSLEVSDLDATYLVSDVCGPLSLVRRAGRCNRRGENPESQLIVVGDADADTEALAGAVWRSRRANMASALKLAQGPAGAQPFDADFWKNLV